MVRYLKLILFSIFFFGMRSYAETAPEFQFRMEFSKKEVFVGEQVLCNYVIYTPHEVVDVEVAKFAEFRGFWKENLILRQGPISTLFGLGAGPNSATIGSYQIIPMIGAQEHVLEPMKIVLKLPGARRVEGSVPPQIVFSEGPKLVIKSLPPPPSGTPWNHFAGAVGRFSSLSSDAVVNFQKREPAQLRLTLQGQGNFPEISQLTPVFPEGVKLVSAKSSIIGNGTFGAKTFDMVLTIDRDTDFDLEPINFVYFDPDSARYQVLNTPSIRFRKETTTAKDLEEDAPLALGPIHKEWHQSKNIEERPFFWVGQALTGICLLWVFRGQRRRKIRVNGKVSPRKHRRQRLAHAELLVRSGQFEPFIKLANDLAVESLKERAQTQERGITTKKLLQVVKSELDVHTFQECQRIFTTYETSLFSPNHQAPQDPEALLSALKRVVG